MYRMINTYLASWAKSPIRTPLIIRGARQVGKSYSVGEFGRNVFKNLVELDLETQPQFRSCFESLDAHKICAQIELIANANIRPGETLLFIDEVQTSKTALKSLSSFKENMPELHVIAAGSLLEFALQDTESFSFPVGRVSFAYLQPLSFREFLLALGEDKLCRALAESTVANPCSQAVHQKLLDLVRLYFVVGGMPEAISAYLATQSILEARRVQTRLNTAFVADFAKYARRYDHRKLQQLISAVPRLVGRKFKFSHIDPAANARDFKLPLLDLERAGLVRIVRASSGYGIPLGSEERQGIFKAQFLDIGLMINSLGLDLFSTTNEMALFANEGALAEQFVGQELLAFRDQEDTPQLYYWVREAKGSQAELDFLYAAGSDVIPIEVKSGATGRLRSLQQFMSEKKSKIGIRISQHPLSQIDNLLSVPLYMVAEIPRFIQHR